MMRKLLKFILKLRFENYKNLLKRSDNFDLHRAIFFLNIKLFSCSFNKTTKPAKLQNNFFPARFRKRKLIILSINRH